MSGQERSALGLQLDAVELMIARDMVRGRESETLRATLVTVAHKLGIAGPADTEMVKKAIDALLASAAKVAEPPEPHDHAPTIDIFRVAREWFEEHPYEEDDANDEALSYFESFSNTLVAGVDPLDTTFADQLRDLLNGQGFEGVRDSNEIRKILSCLASDAAQHRAKIGESHVVATLTRQLEEATNTVSNYKETVARLEREAFDLREKQKPSPRKRAPKKAKAT